MSFVSARVYEPKQVAETSGPPASLPVNLRGRAPVSLAHPAPRRLVAPNRPWALQLALADRIVLERLAGDPHRSAARWARIILARSEGATLGGIAASEKVHRDTVRRCLQRFRRHGIGGLRHGNAGKSKNLTFDASVRREIARRASLPPREVNENFATWSLYKLREHLVRAGIVRSISIERLRYILGVEPHDRAYWPKAETLLSPLSREARRELIELAQGADAEIARRAGAVLAVASGARLGQVAREFHCGKSSIRRWLDHVRLHGVSRLAGLRPAAAA